MRNVFGHTIPPKSGPLRWVSDSMENSLEATMQGEESDWTQVFPMGPSFDKGFGCWGNIVVTLASRYSS
ncbi:hypothetical protein FOZ61_001232 [Perkinsus olseni]|uniref:Uncharacterized protein n=1 Tax=Perkinsus olseni TaxID=32597 RepID=A0A7J6KRM9_PEROL|nr:hypothetical protein FOZ61_001232 [Perkinsus olseni]